MRVTVILPSLNPDQRLVQTVQGLLGEGFERIVVVDDGSDQAHQEPFAQIAGLPGCVLLRHGKNLGKGRALKTGFNYFLCHTEQDVGVVTADGDGQHHPADVARCARELEAFPDSVVLGCRDFSGPDVPARSRAGNRTACAMFRLAAGLKISDTQTGLRAFSRRAVWELLDVEGERFEYETLMLLELPGRGIPFREVPIRTIYLDENSSSHFRPVADSLRILRLLLRFVAASLASFGVDIVAFWLLNLVLGDMELSRRVLLATVGARLLSSLFNYAVNHKVVFARKKGVKGSLWRYYLLCVVQTALSYGGVYLLSLALGGRGEVLCKIAVDLALFFLSFQIQREWVFREEKP